MFGTYPLDRKKIIGGVEAVTSTIVDALVDEDAVDQICVVSFKTTIHKPKIVRSNQKLTIYYLPSQKRFLLPTNAVINQWQAKKIYNSFKPDIVHSQGIGSDGLITSQFNCPKIVTVHGLVHIESKIASNGSILNKLRTILLKINVRNILAKANAVISTTNYDARMISNYVSCYHPIISNPVPREYFSQKAIHISQKNVLFAGMCVRRKNILGILKAFKGVVGDCPDALLTLVGPSPDKNYKKEVLDEIQSSGLNECVRILGLLEANELIEELKRCKFIVLFSDEETSPTIIAQAMAIGKPIIATNVGGISEMVTDGQNGFLINPRDTEALASRMKYLLTNDNVCNLMAEVSRTRALQQFFPDNIAKKTVEVYQKSLREASE